MAFWNLNNLSLKAFRPGIMSAAEDGKDLIMVCMEIAPEMEDTGHAHAFDQCGWVVEGRIEMFIGEEQKLLNANEAYFIPSGVQHGWKTFDRPVRLMDVSLKA
ncbi:MAG: cupin domain-containing protein [Deltaproteobacteria bacterium]|nr:cupin domain-containing protein [Deltaproteobacteria bacterium]